MFAVSEQHQDHWGGKKPTESVRRLKKIRIFLWHYDALCFYTHIFNPKAPTVRYEFDTRDACVPNTEQQSAVLPVYNPNLCFHSRKVL